VDGLGRVWHPYDSIVGAGFQPYSTHGHWVYTDAGWAWASDYDWGWAPFHYGRWWIDSLYGWVWLPGSTWAPAWVSWRYGGGYAGWAPLTPMGYVWGAGYWGRSWCFTETRYMTSPGVATYVVHGDRVGTIYQSTNEVRGSGHGWNAGPPVENVAHAVGSPIHAITVAHSGTLPPSSAHPSPTPLSGSGAHTQPTPIHPFPSAASSLRELQTPSRADISRAGSNDPHAAVAPRTWPSASSQPAQAAPSLRPTPGVPRTAVSPLSPSVARSPIPAAPVYRQQPTVSSQTYSRSGGYPSAPPSVPASRPSYNQNSFSSRPTNNSSNSYRPAPSYSTRPSYSSPSYSPHAPSSYRQPSFAQPQPAQRSAAQPANVPPPARGGGHGGGKHR